MSLIRYTDPYMDWSPLGEHAPGCTRVGWDVRMHRSEHHTGRREIGIRAICPEIGGCGVVTELEFDLAPDRDPKTEDLRSGMAESFGGVGLIGYGTRPQRVGDVWLHAGPPFAVTWTADEGPEWWYVTRSVTPPTRVQETLGKVFRLRKNGRQLKGRFGAGAGWTIGKYVGANLAEVREDLTSRTAAAHWVGQRAAELAAAAAAGGEPG